MKTKTIIVLLLVAMTVAIGACKQQQENKRPAQYPAGRIYTPADIKHLQDAANIDQKNVSGWITLGNALMDSGRYSEGIDAYQKALALDPKNTNVRVDLGTCYRRVGQPDRAAAEFRKALKSEPNHPNGHRNLGVVLAYDLNQKAQGAKEFEKYLELKPNAPDAVQIRQIITELKAGR